MPTKVFMIHKTGLTHRFLRRWESGSNCSAANHGYHNAMVFIDKGLLGEFSTTVAAHIDKTDPRWPKKCQCGYEFTDKDEWQLKVDPEYCRVDDAEIVYTLQNAPAGAMWNADWMETIQDEPLGPDGKYLVVRTHGGDWEIDGRARNCTRPDDNVHKCWVRHGVPPNITVNKNGNTCNAGAGSIIVGGYHGFLRNGELTDHIG